MRQIDALAKKLVEALVVACFGCFRLLAVELDHALCEGDERVHRGGRPRSRGDALAEITDARVWAGLHFRTADLQGQQLGKTAAEYVTSNFFRPVGVR